jgi:predicted transcriptional regulator of viral defense system
MPYFSERESLLKKNAITSGRGLMGSSSYQQSGYFTAGQARRHGVSRQFLNHLRQGRFERVQQGLYRVWSFPGSQFDEIREKWMAVGRDKAIVSHERALLLHDLSNNVPDEVHLLVPRRFRGIRRPPGVVLHTHPDDEKVATTWGDAMPITAPARTLVDVAERIQPDQAAMAAREALHLGLLTRRQLEQEAARQRKVRVLDVLLPDG